LRRLTCGYSSYLMRNECDCKCPCTISSGKAK
jgi:hypothetical protein